MQMTPNSMILFSAKILKTYAIVWSAVYYRCVKKWMNENRLMLNDNKNRSLIDCDAGSLRNLERSSIHIL